MTDWKNVKHKTLRNSEKEYISQSKILVPAKKPPTVCIKVNDPMRKRTGKIDATSQRFCSFKYYIDDLQNRVMTLQDKIKSSIMTPRDNCGKHLNKPHAINASVRDLIRQHINSLSCQPCYYSLMAIQITCNV
ncbi:hypothetical protein QTP88_025694 [Uroleucon formosanum]